jgi:hypothetical protein
MTNATPSPNSEGRHIPGEQDKRKPGELGARDPAGKVEGGLRGQQTGADEAGSGDSLNLEQQNRQKR